ncbi:unnamed protein product [Cylindrotheca closterium]|uniref:Uncharacterized protein n=1 Tax=Cylindrotheca closterium TaxID=2856 RepID=A0AAD2CJE9_9STRA|nr:unnamed protein product [Cylindrotheca closterium]
MKDSTTNPPEKDPNSIMTVADQGQGGLEEKTRSNSTTQSSIALTKDNPAITPSQLRSKRSPSKTAEDGAMKGSSLVPSDVAQGHDGSMAKAQSNSTTPSSTDFTEDNPDTMLSKSQRKQTPPSKTAEDGAVQGRPLVAYTKKLRVSKFHRLYKKAWRQEVFGNQAFITWSSRTAEHFGHAISKCPGWWAEASTDQADAHSYDEIAALILSGLKVYDPSLGGSMPQLRSSMQNLFSLGDLDDADDDEASWSLHEYFLRLATQCPTVVFDLAAAQRVIKTDEKSPRFWEFALVFDPTLIVQRAEPLTWMWLAASEFFAHPWTGPVILPPVVEEFERLERESKISKAQSKSKKRPASTPENPKGAKANDSRPSPAVPMQTDPAPKGRSQPFQRTPPSDATPPRQQVILSDAVHVIASTPTGTQEASAPTDAVVEASKPASSQNTPLACAVLASSVNDGVSTPPTDAPCADWRRTTYMFPAALPTGPRPSGSSYSKNSKNGSSPPPPLHPLPNSSGPFFAPSAPLATRLKHRLRGTASTECVLPPSPKSVRPNSALAPNASSKAFSPTAGPTSSNNSTALAVVAGPVTFGLPIYLDSSSFSVKACGSIAMMSFILTTTSSTNSVRLLLIDAYMTSSTWVLATCLGTFVLPSVDPAL